MKTANKQSKLQRVETGTRKLPIRQVSPIASGTFIQQGLYILTAKTIDRTSLSTGSIKHRLHLDQKTLSKSAAKSYLQVDNARTGEQAWLLKNIQTLEKLGNLPVNWDSYGANPPNSTALFWGRTVFEILFNMNFPPTRIMPSADEGIGICFISGKKYADIECFNTGEIVAVTSDGQGNPNVWEVNPDREELKNSLNRIRVYLQS
jgi:hypothetical protein